MTTNRNLNYQIKGATKPAKEHTAETLT